MPPKAGVLKARFHGWRYSEEKGLLASDQRALTSPTGLKSGPGWRKQVTRGMPLRAIFSLLCHMLLL